MTTAVLFRSLGRCNIPGEQTFKLDLTYGSSAIASAKGRFLAVEDTDAGKMTITFPTPFRRLSGFRWGWKKHADGAAVFYPVVLTDTLSTDGKLVVVTRTEAGTATDPTSGDVLGLEFDVTDDILDDEGSITVTTP